MKYLLLGAITESGQRLSPPDLESWMAEIGAWYEKHATTGKLADAGYLALAPAPATAPAQTAGAGAARQALRSP